MCTSFYKCTSLNTLLVQESESVQRALVGAGSERTLRVVEERMAASNAVKEVHQEGSGNPASGEELPSE